MTAANICDAGHPGCFYIHAGVNASNELMTAIVRTLHELLPGTTITMYSADKSSAYVEIEIPGTGLAFIAGDNDDTFGVSVLRECSDERLAGYEMNDRLYSLDDSHESELTDASPAGEIAEYIAHVVTSVRDEQR